MRQRVRGVLICLISSILWASTSGVGGEPTSSWLLAEEDEVSPPADEDWEMPVDCADGDPCTRDSFDGQCVHEPMDCDDGDACTQDLCEGGQCFSLPAVDCNDGNPCTNDDCAAGECISKPMDCDDGDACTRDFCEDGQCFSLASIDCDDYDPCTDDSCFDGKCVNEARVCDDGDACTEDFCESGQCFSLPAVDCTDQDPCTSDFCRDGSCINEPIACDDGDSCTEDFCDAGQCYSSPPVDCDDGDSCTHDYCAGGTCINQQKSCNDGNPCTADGCDAGTCYHLNIKDCEAPEPDVDVGLKPIIMTLSSIGVDGEASENTFLIDWSDHYEDVSPDLEQYLYGGISCEEALLLEDYATYETETDWNWLVDDISILGIDMTANLLFEILADLLIKPKSKKVKVALPQCHQGEFWAKISRKRAIYKFWIEYRGFTFVFVTVRAVYMDDAEGILKNLSPDVCQGHFLEPCEYCDESGAVESMPEGSAIQGEECKECDGAGDVQMKSEGTLVSWSDCEECDGLGGIASFCEGSEACCGSLCCGTVCCSNVCCASGEVCCDGNCTPTLICPE